MTGSELASSIPAAAKYIYYYLMDMKRITDLLLKCIGHWPLIMSISSLCP